MPSLLDQLIPPRAHDAFLKPTLLDRLLPDSPKPKLPQANPVNWFDERVRQDRLKAWSENNSRFINDRLDSEKWEEKYREPFAQAVNEFTTQFPGEKWEDYKARYDDISYGYDLARQYMGDNRAKVEPRVKAMTPAQRKFFDQAVSDIGDLRSKPTPERLQRIKNDPVSSIGDSTLSPDERFAAAYMWYRRRAGLDKDYEQLEGKYKPDENISEVPWLVERTPFGRRAVNYLLSKEKDAAVNRVKDGTATSTDYATLAREIVAAEKLAARSSDDNTLAQNYAGLLRNTIDGLGSTAALAGEFYMLAPAATASTASILGQAAPNAGKLATLGRGLVTSAIQGAASGAPLEYAAKREEDRISLHDPYGNPQIQYQDGIENPLLAAGLGTLDATAEVGIERAGGALVRGAGKVARKMPGIGKVMGPPKPPLPGGESVGFSGIPGEALEERMQEWYGGIMRQPGQEDFGLTGSVARGEWDKAAHQAVVEAAVLGIFQGGNVAGNLSRPKIDRLREAAQARIDERVGDLSRFELNPIAWAVENPQAAQAMPDKPSRTQWAESGLPPEVGRSASIREAFTAIAKLTVEPSSVFTPEEVEQVIAETPEVVPEEEFAAPTVQAQAQPQTQPQVAPQVQPDIQMGPVQDVQQPQQPPLNMTVEEPAAEVQTEKLTLRNADLLDDLASRHEAIAGAIDEDAGVKEGYTIGEHTRRVLANYRVQSDQSEIADLSGRLGMDVGRLMEHAVALHDMGKPQAVKLGQKSRQHEFTKPILEQVLRDEGFADSEVALASTLVNNDILGKVLQGKKDASTAIRELEAAAKQANVPLQDYLRLQTLLYVSDAASYPALRQKVFTEQDGKLYTANVNLGMIEEAVYGQVRTNPWIAGPGTPGRIDGRPGSGGTRRIPLGRWKHGTGIKFEQPDPTKDSGKNLVGRGFYLVQSTDADVGEHYSRRAIKHVLGLFNPKYRERIRTATPESIQPIIEKAHRKMEQARANGDTAIVAKYEQAIAVLNEIAAGNLGEHVLDVEFTPQKTLVLGAQDTGGEVLSQSVRDEISSQFPDAPKNLSSRGFEFYNALRKQYGSDAVTEAMRAAGYDSVQFIHRKGGFKRPYEVIVALDMEQTKIGQRREIPTRRIALQPRRTGEKKVRAEKLTLQPRKEVIPDKVQQETRREEGRQGLLKPPTEPAPEGEPARVPNTQQTPLEPEPAAPAPTDATPEAQGAVKPPKTTLAPPADTAPAVSDTKETAGQSVAAIEDAAKHPVVEYPIDRLTLSPDVPQFKEDADAEGIVEGQQLEGQYNRLGTGAIIVWERENGRSEVITGRHRFDLAKRKGETTIPAQVVREADGFTKEQALILDAEANIQDEKGSIRDFATYFKHSPVTEPEARERGLLSRAPQRQAFRLGKDAEDSLYQTWRAGKISTAKAAAIAEAAPKDEELQVAAMSQADMSADELKGYIALAKAKSKDKASSGKQGDLFGFDDTAITDMRAMAKAAGSIQEELRRELSVIRNPAKRKELAQQYFSGDFDALPARVQELNELIDRWDRWTTDVELVKQVEAKVSGKPTKATIAPTPESLTRSPNVLRISPAPIGKASLGRSERLFSQLRRWLTTKGNLPQDIYDSKVTRDGSVQREARAVEFAVADLKDAVAVAEKDGVLTQAGRKRLDAALKGDQAAMASLPVPVQNALRKMRTHVDALSRRILANGLVEGELELTIENNLGTYLTRSYQVFDDPNWSEKVPKDVRNKAHAWVRAEYPDLNDQQIKNMLDDLLYREGAPLSLLKTGKLGSKDLGILKARKAIPKELRDLMGEYKDPFVNYTRSVAKMANLVANHEFLQDVRDSGLGKYFFEQNDPNRPEGFNAKISADASKAMEPLNGLMTTPELKRAFEEVYERNNDHWFIRGWLKLNSAAKVSKTALSHASTVRNLLGNVEFAISNGHWTGYGKSVGAAAEDLRTILPSRLRRNIRTTEDMRQYIQRLSELGVLDGSVDSGELRTSLGDIVNGTPDFIADNQLAKAVSVFKKVMDVQMRTYQLVDNVWKVIGFESERARLEKAYKDAGQPLSDAELDRRAADIVTRILPTYSKINKAVREWRKVPLIGSFVSWPSEVVRTKYHAIRQGIEELNDPIRRTIGAKRLAGHAATMALPGILALISRFLLGLTRDDDEDLREFMPPWQRGSDIMWLWKDEQGNPVYVDLGWLFPNSYLRSPFVSAMSGDDIGEATQNFAAEVGEPFVSEEIFTGKALDVWRNRTQSDRDVYNEADPLGQQLLDSAMHIGEAFEPGTITSLRRVKKGALGETDRWGRDYELPVEVASLAAGLRIQKMDVAQGVFFQGKRYTRQYRDAASDFTDLIGNRGTVSTGKIATEYAQAEAAHRKLFDDARNMANAAIRLGVPEETVRSELIAGGMGREKADKLLKGEYVPYELSTELQKKVAETPDAEARMNAYYEARAKVTGRDVKDEKRSQLIQSAPTHFRNLMQSEPSDADKRKEWSADRDAAKKWIKSAGLSKQEAIDAAEDWARRESEARSKSNTLESRRNRAKNIAIKVARFKTLMGW